MTGQGPSTCSDSSLSVDDNCLGSDLHRVCSQRPCARLDEIQGLVSLAALQVRDPTDKWLPIHRLCRRQPSLQVIQHVVHLWPESVRQWTADSALQARLPIHLACQYGASLSVIQYLGKVDPSSLQAQTTYREYTPLHYAYEYYLSCRANGDRSNECEEQSALEVIEWLETQQLCQHQRKRRHSISSSTTTTDYSTEQPSSSSTLSMSSAGAESDHDDYSTSSSSDVLSSDSEVPQHQQTPARSRSKDLLSKMRTEHKKDKPTKPPLAKQLSRKVLRAIEKLQDACWEEPPSLKKISKLVKACPEAVREARTEHGEYTLLHQVCWNVASVVATTISSDILNIMACLIQTWPESVQQVTSHGDLPLHLLISGCSCLPAVKALASETSTQSENSTLNIVLAKLVNFLIRKHPASLKQPATSNGYLPLHYATHCGAPLSVVKALLTCYPKALHIQATASKKVKKNEDVSTILDADYDWHTSTSTSPLALAHRSIWGDKTKRPDVIAWLTGLYQEKEQQRQGMLEYQVQEQHQDALQATRPEQTTLSHQDVEAPEDDPPHHETAASQTEEEAESEEISFQEQRHATQPEAVDPTSLSDARDATESCGISTSPTATRTSQPQEPTEEENQPPQRRQDTVVVQIEEDHQDPSSQKLNNSTKSSLADADEAADPSTSSSTPVLATVQEAGHSSSSSRPRAGFKFLFRRSDS